MTLVLNGHYIAGTEARLVSTGDQGNRVVQLFANYQTLATGGLGLMRLMTLDPEQRKLSVRTYTPELDYYREDPASQFEVTDLSFDPI
jgi:hypothetical protein